MSGLTHALSGITPIFFRVLDFGGRGKTATKKRRRTVAFLKNFQL